MQAWRLRWQHKQGNMERWDRDALEGGASRLWSGLRLPLPASSLCGRLDVLVSSSGVVVVLLLLGSVSDKWGRKEYVE